MFRSDVNTKQKTLVDVPLNRREEMQERLAAVAKGPAISHS